MSADTLTSSALLERIQRDGVRKTAIALRKPPLSSRLLQELAELPSPTVAQQFVAAYPLSPSHLLESLAQTAQDPEVFPFLATNPRTPPHLLSTFAAHENPEVRAHVATHPQLAARELLHLAQDTDVAVRRAVATNPSLRLPHHAALTTDANPGVRLRLATQPALPAQVALVLAADASIIVRTHTIAATTADEELLLGWAASDEEEVQLALASRKNLPTAARSVLLLSPHASVRRVARDLIEPDSVALLHFVTNGEPDEHAWVAVRPSLPAPLQRLLAPSPHLPVRLALAANPSLVPDVADNFATLAEESVCVALATNPSLSSDHVQSLAATRLPAVLTALAYRDDLYEELIPFLIEHSPDFLRHWAVQQKPAALTDPTLARRLLADSLPTIRALAVASHPWRRADLYDFARDPAAVVRLAALRHAQASGELVASLLTDPSAEVATAAEEIRAARATAARSAPKAPSPSIPSPDPITRSASELSALNSQLSTAPLAPRHAPPPAPKLFNQLKSLFWQ
ncbi:MAG: hypothetical protein H7343_04630 [Undibacterium sp.]|nr:hypothetical protein [Opitutaceae bacterium]